LEPTRRFAAKPNRIDIGSGTRRPRSISALDDYLPARAAARVESPEAVKPARVVESTQQAASPVDDRDVRCDLKLRSERTSPS
jgi:hypothetical protein